MALNITREVAAMQRMTAKELQEKYAEVFGEQPRSRNKQWLVKRIAWRMQTNEEGDLSERARRRAMELANDADLRVTAPRRPKSGDSEPAKTVRLRTDRRLPMPGAIITREYKGEMVQVTVLPRGFEYEGEVYASLSAVAKVVTGTHWNGYHFFGLRQKGGDR